MSSGCSQEEVPVAVTTAVGLVAMGTSMAGKKTQSGQQGQVDSVLSFLNEGISTKSAEDASAVPNRSHMISLVGETH